MSLKKIEIFGFKSFADRTTILFSEAISAIVGPNGCGKSNIVDAFLWVLGEQSATLLRGSKMLDVIFAGTNKRKALNMAEVTLTFDNSKRFLSLPCDEVAITRRLYRDGESEYLINKQQARLKDIRELFVHTGIGKEAFAVIGQGKVAELMNQTAQERRALFEEVAGIAHFLQKRKESTRKLELADQNFSRAQDIYKEVSVQKETLEKQAQEARKFQEERDRLAKCEKQLGVRKYKEYKKQLTALQEKLQESEKQLKFSSEKEIALQEKITQKKAAFKKWQEARSEKNSESYQIKTRAEMVQKELAAAKEQQELAHKNLSRAKEKMGEYQLQLAGYQNEIQAHSKQLEVLTKELEALTAEKTKKQEEYLQLQRRLEAREKQERELSRNRMQLFSRLQQLESELKKSQLAEEVAQEKLAERLKKKEELSLQMEAFEAEISKKKEELALDVKSAEEKKKEHANSTLSLLEQEKQLEAIKRQIDLKRSALIEVSTKQKVLERMASDLEGYSVAAKALLKEAKNPSSLLYKKLYSLTEFVEEAVGVADSTLVVESLLDLQRCLDMKTKELSIICLELLGIKKEELGRHLGESLVTCETIESAKAHIGRTIFVSSNLLIDAFGVIHTAAKKEQSLFTQKKQQKELESTRLLLEEEQKQLQSQKEEAEKKRIDSLKQRQIFDEEMRKADMRVVSSNFQLQAQEKQKQQCHAALQAQESERVSLEKLVATLKQEADGKSQQLLSLNEAKERLEASVQSSESEDAAFKQELEKAAENKQKSHELVERKRAEVTQISHAIELIRLQEKQTKTLYEQSLYHQKNGQYELEKFSKKEESLTKELHSLQVQAHELQLAMKQQEGGALLEQEIASIEAESMALQKNKEQFVGSYSSQKTQEEHLKTALEAVLEYAEEEAEETAETIQELERKCARLRSLVERTKNVNLMAIEEHEAVVARYDMLQLQLQDLQLAKEELVQIIQSLEKESRSAFTETFSAVREAFKKHFQTLFNGGEADLVLSEGSDILASGVEIIAQPPGKQMRSMHLMSGGEKSLVALALLFACFDIKPAPFCILDEVEAALDETNVERFGKLLLTFQQRCQFLLITHSKRTMAIADTLLGVSMQEKGVSRIISIDFQRKAAVAVL